MKVLVLYQSRNGHTRQTAETITQAVRNLNHSVTLKSVIEVMKSDVDKADILFIGTWVQGFILFGVKPAGADLWVPSLPTLEDKPIAIFCTYAFNPGKSLQTLRLMLQARGARIVGQHTFHRSNPNNGVEAFVQSVL